MVELAGRAEIGGAEEGEPVVLLVGRHDPQAGIADVLRQLARRAVGRHLEDGWIVDQLARLAAVDDVDADGQLKVAAEMEQPDWCPAVRDLQRRLRPVFDLPVGVVIDLVENLRIARLRRNIGLHGKTPGVVGEKLE